MARVPEHAGEVVTGSRRRPGCRSAIAAVLGRFLAWLVTDLVHYGSAPFTFPLLAVAFGVIATLALAWLVDIGPVHRAIRLEPGTALRYE